MICLECKNENDLTSATLKVSDVWECPFCGIEFEVTAVDATAEFTLEIIEEEK
jgi:ribosomal protein L37AE/L43A